MRFLVLVNILLVFTSFSQSRTDTLFLGGKKYPLKQVQTFFPSQPGPVMLPCEYKEIANYANGKIVNYRRASDSAESTFLDNTGSEVTIKVWRKSCDSSDYNYTTLYSFTDSVVIPFKDLPKLRPYIKSGSKRIYFCAARLLTLVNGILYESRCERNESGYLVGYLNVDQLEKNNELKNAAYILDNFYYRKNNATYFLEREFIIKLK
jgi:hypothetical protein